ncbi:MAG: site-2 protease family protein [Chloroflexi bacterium]|nr:site-2 protease family protein [Chloroflexota bacterium]
MGGSIRLITIAGIDIRMHMTFPLILIWAALQYGLFLRLGLQGAAFGVLVTLLLFVVVLLHELGHSFAALAYRIPVRRIVLLPIGGVAELARMPSRPSQELVVALAGPAVNVVLAIILYGVALVTPLGASLEQGRLFALFSRGALANPAEAVFQYVFAANLGLLLFNMLPAFPLDGGRVLRSLLAMVLGQVRATRVAVVVGQFAAAIFGLFGLLTGNFLLVVLAVFIYLAGTQEGRMVRALSVLDGVRVGQARIRPALSVAPQQSLGDVQALRWQTFQPDFPVSDGTAVVGLLTASDLEAALQHQPAWTLVRTVMRAEFPLARTDDLLTDVQQRMVDTGLAVAPVVDAGGALVGLLTAGDITELYQLLAAQQRAWGPGTNRPATRP